MDKIVDLTMVVRNEVGDYNNSLGYKSKGYFLEDTEQQAYAMIDVPDPHHLLTIKPGIVVMARVINDKVIIDADTTGRPLYQELMRRGIPRERIILAYAGEKLPDDKE